ncbi:cache domain-containing protein, partial [candidate division WOR-3 bacterium]|nr:cache domain-containing protein [candidate division WOR-3 bacterium]
MKIFLRTKLIVSLVLVVLISGVISMIVGVRLLGDGIIKQAQDKVRLDLNSAREVYQEESGNIKDIVRLTAIRFFMRDAIVSKNRKKLQVELQRIRESEYLDILTLIDKEGYVLVRARNPENYGDQLNDEMANWVFLNKEVIVKTQIISKNELQKESKELADRARIALISTPKARPREEIEETSGMMIKAAAPVFDYDGNLIGVLYGGKLLNRNYEIVDKVKDMVYKSEKYKDKDIGTATIFQGDLRISTNVMRTDGARAIGTRVSEEVYDKVIEKGTPWIGRAFVVNAWYITAYEPIKNIKGQVIGILYVGILEEKFTDMRINIVSTFIGVTILGIAIAFGVTLVLANSIVKPVSRLTTASRHIADGDFSYKVDIKSNDEIGELGNIFNFMVRSIRERDTKIKEFAQAKMAEAERLAMIGQLAAGVAHEINNPLTGIILYCDIVLKSMPEDDVKRKSLEKIYHEAMRCKSIVKGLLDFARHKKPETKEASVNQTLETTLSLVKNQPLFHNIHLKNDLDQSLPLIKIDAGQIQQVFMNIIMNAVEAMDGKGDLSIKSQLSEDEKYIEISFTDTGPGIKSEHLKRIFEPFFTTKDASHGGVGIGLAISYRIIRNHNGRVDVTSEMRKGTT